MVPGLFTRFMVDLQVCFAVERGPLGKGGGGGVREAAIGWWPGKITPGRSMEVASTLDLYPTILNITGAPAPENVTMDGIDMSPILFEGKVSQRDHFFYYPPDPTQDADIYAIRWKQYKAHYFTKGGSCSTLISMRSAA